MSETPAQPHFRLGRELGAGASGRVFHAVLTQGFGPYPAGFELAVKYQHAEVEKDARASAAFDAESTAGRAVLHPGIVHVIHSGRDERGRFLVMPFVPGRNLREVAHDSDTLPEPLLRSIARQISGGLAALHASGFVHGDIKPENIRLDAEGNAVLLDLGFAHADETPRASSSESSAQSGASESATHSSSSESPSHFGAKESLSRVNTSDSSARIGASGSPSRMGASDPSARIGASETIDRFDDADEEALELTSTPESRAPGSALEARPRSVVARPGSLPYISPEQARGEYGSSASDVFSLCVVLYELCTGAHPFAAFAQHASREGHRALASHPALDGIGSSAWIARTAIEKPNADALIAAIATARFVAPSRHLPELSPFLDRVLQDGLQRDPARRPDSREIHRRFTEQERGAWWRAEIEFEADARRGGSGERDAQHVTPLVGRERELEELLAAYETAVESHDDATSDDILVAKRDLSPRAAERGLHALQPIRVDERPRSGSGGVVWIRGAPGLGKSRLVNEFASRARTRMNPPLYLYGRCREFEEDRPCQPILRLLERYLRLPPRAAPKERERALLEKLVPPRAAETLARVLDPEYEGSTPLSVLVALSMWLAALGKEVPVIIFLDDVNWAGEDTLNVLSLLAEKLAETRLLLVLGTRGESHARAPRALARATERLAARARTSTIELEPLDEAAVEAFVHRIFHHSTPRLRLASVLWQRSRGNPGLLSEILRGLIARGAAPQHPSGDGRVLTISPDDLPLPGSLQKAIRDSFKLLPAGDRTWLRRLAVVGGRIETEFLLKAFPDAKRSEIDPMLARLVRSGWLKPAGARYRFMRPALREAVYRSLTREQSVRLHAAAAEALRPALGEHLSLEDAFQIAFHLRAARDHTTLLRLLKPLLARLLRSGQPQRVHPLALWGLEALDELPRSRDTDRVRIELLEAAVDAADRLGFRQGQRELLDRLTDLEVDPTVDPEVVGRVYLLHGRYAVSTAQYGLARGMLRNAVEMFERSESRLERSEALRRLSLVQGHVGELGEARSLARRALEGSQHDPQRALAHLALGTVDVLEDRVESALRNTDASLSLMKRDPSFHLPGVYAAAYMLRARVYRIAGAPARALASASRAVRLARIAGERRLEAEATARLGGMLLDLDRADEAESRLRAALLLAEEIEDRRGQALARLFLGTLLWENDDPESGPMLARAGELAVEMGLNRVEAVCLSIQARIRREKGDTDGARVATERAASLLKQYGAELADRIVILGTRVLVLRTVGQADSAAGIEKRLRDRLRRETARIRSPLLRLRHGRASLRLLEAVLSADGPIYPRLRAAE
jgi:serine/threonine protein kinase/tetratricopeptide (TPR) repeat protein